MAAMVRRGAARRGKAWQGMARHGEARQGKAGHGKGTSVQKGMAMSNDEDTRFKREAAWVTLKPMLDAKKPGERITAADVVNATGFDDWRGFGERIRSWAERAGVVLFPVVNDGWRIGMEEEKLDAAESKRRAAFRRTKRELGILVSVDGSKLSETKLRRHQAQLVRAQARTQQAKAHDAELSKEFKLDSRPPLRALTGEKK